MFSATTAAIASPAESDTPVRMSQTRPKSAIRGSTTTNTASTAIATAGPIHRFIRRIGRA